MFKNGLFVLVLFCTCANSHANLITYKFSGTTQGVLATPPNSPFELSLTLDTDATNVNPGLYEDTITDFSLMYGSYSFITSPFSNLSLSLGNLLHPPYDIITFIANLPDQPALGYSNVEIILNLIDYSRTALEEDNSWPTSLSLDDFDRAFLTLTVFREGERFNTVSVSQISSISTSQIPEPSNYAIFLLGLLGLIYSRKYSYLSPSITS